MTQAQMRQHLGKILETYHENPETATHSTHLLIRSALPTYPDFLIAPNDIGISILHEAANCNALEIIKLLHQQYACDTNIVMAITRFTPLHFAASHGYTDSSLEIIKIDNSSLNAQDMNGCTPLYLALVNGHTDLALTLIKYGADVGLVQDFLTSFLLEPSLYAISSPLSFGLVTMERDKVILDRLVTPLIEARNPENNMPIVNVRCKDKDGYSTLDAAMLLNCYYIPLDIITKIRQAAQESSLLLLSHHTDSELVYTESHKDGPPDAKRYKPNYESDDEMDDEMADQGSARHLPSPADHDHEFLPVCGGDTDVDTW